MGTAVTLTEIVTRTAKPHDRLYCLADAQEHYLKLTAACGRFRRPRYRLRNKAKMLSLTAYPAQRYG